MLNITAQQDGATLTMTLSGRVDTDTAPELDDAVAVTPANVKSLVLDMEDLEYVSSSGLRVLLVATRMMRSRGGECVLTNVPELITETFDMTGLLDVFAIQ